MEIIRQLPLTMNKVQGGDVTVSLPIAFRVTEYFRESLDEFVKTGMRCVSVFDDMVDYKYSTISNAYAKISPIDVAGYVASVDWDTLTVTMIIDDDYENEESAHYVRPEDWGYYVLMLRARVTMEYDNDPSTGKIVEYAAVSELFGLDLVKIVPTSSLNGVLML